MKLPKHKNPISNDGLVPKRTACAPYNFIPLPEVIVKAVGDAACLPNHSSYNNPGYPHTGYFEVSLTTKSSLYVRCPFTLDEFLKQERKEDEKEPFRKQIKNKPDFFYTREKNKPVIPGSSLRGMLRNILEIVSYSKVQWITDKQLFFRTVDNTTVGKYYRGRMIGKVETGFLNKRSSGYSITVCEIARVSQNKLDEHLYDKRGGYLTPKWSGKLHTWQTVWIKLANSNKYVEEIKCERAEDFKEGRLVITGKMQQKKNEFVFLLPEQNAEEIRVSKEIIERFHDDDQITPWQQKAFPKNQPENNNRERDGYLRKQWLDGDKGDPVFFLRENGNLTFLGRAQMFRLPYEKSPLDFVPEDLRRSETIDYAEAMFGFVRTRRELDEMASKPEQGEKGRAYASRVFVTDANLDKEQTEIWLEEQAIVPRILASPKPTTFQHYLVQTNSSKNSLKHYGSNTPRETVIRGHKRYWHQDNQESDAIKDQEVPENSTQHTQFKPVKSGVQFVFRVHFENLSDRELGALCWVLHPLGDKTKTYCHKLGMGKPLGMGAVRLDATLHLTERKKRYTSLFQNDNKWQEGKLLGQKLSERGTLQKLTRPFEQDILSNLKPRQPCENLADLERIGMLLKMMEWPGYPPKYPAASNNRVVNGRPNTRYMLIELPGVTGANKNEYKDRPVLPDPSAFGTLTGSAEPNLSNSKTDSSPSNQPPSKPSQNQPPPRINGDVQLIKQQINALGGAGEVSRMDQLVNKIKKLDDGATRQECALQLQAWLKKTKLWQKQKHKNKPWRKGLEEILPNNDI